MPHFCSLAAAVSHTCKTHRFFVVIKIISKIKKTYEFNNEHTKSQKIPHAHKHTTLTLARGKFNCHDYIITHMWLCVCLFVLHASVSIVLENNINKYAPNVKWLNDLL